MLENFTVLSIEKKFYGILIILFIHFQANQIIEWSIQVHLSKVKLKEEFSIFKVKNLYLQCIIRMVALVIKTWIVNIAKLY